jgi:hypothetical protein
MATLQQEADRLNSHLAELEMQLPSVLDSSLVRLTKTQLDILQVRLGHPARTSPAMKRKFIELFVGRITVALKRHETIDGLSQQAVTLSYHPGSSSGVDLTSVLDEPSRHTVIHPEPLQMTLKIQLSPNTTVSHSRG